MSNWNIAAKSQEERNKVNVDLAARGVAYKERLNIPVIAEQVAREQPENLRTYFMERLRHYRQLSLLLPKGNDPVYQKEDIAGNDSNLLIVFYVQIMPDDFVMQLHRF